ncbi:MAG: hypothetical protein HQ567_26910 [Candidatus Nealsonbacteria bacterium]|nr:hypothetical protein [Candidatus Nealsonbacteria bacterium]
MNTNHRARSAGVCVVLATLVLCGSSWHSTAAAAEPEIVGILAIAMEDDVATALDLDDEQKSKLQDVIYAREDDSLELALKFEDLSLAERWKQFAPFRLESEKLGLAVLTAEQVKMLRGIVARRPDAAPTSSPVAPKESVPATEAAGNVDGASADEVPRSTPIDANVGEPSDPTPATERPRGPFYMPPDKPAGASDAADAAADPVVPAADAVPAEAADGKPVTLQFNFNHQPWKTVIEWFAERAGLSLVTEAYPQGTLNYIDDREYTPVEALDVINSVLLTRGYALVRRRKALMLINLDDGLPPNLIDHITPEELDDRGEYELVAVLFNLNRMTAEEAETEINKLIGPQGAVVPLPKSRQIMVTETGGRLRAILSVITRVEDPLALGENKLRSFELEYAMAEDAMSILRQLLNIPADENATDDGSLRFAMDPLGNRLLVTGKPEMLTRVEEMLKTIDVAGPGQAEEGGIAESPQLVVYTVAPADPEAVLSVLQTMLAGLSDVNLAVDSKTGNLTARARPEQQLTIKATVDAIKGDARRQIDVIQLYTVDPQAAVLAINTLFGVSSEEDGGNANAPQIDADPISGQLLIRATAEEIAQMRELLEKMGEDFSEEGRDEGNRPYRMVPLTGRAARSALEQVQEMWPAMRRNRIRIVTPGAMVPSMRSGGFNEMKKPDVPAPAPSAPVVEPPVVEPPVVEPPVVEPPVVEPPVVEPPTPPAAPSRTSPTMLSAGMFRDAQILLASHTIAQAPSSEPSPVTPSTPIAEPPSAPNEDVAEDPISADPVPPVDANDLPTIVVAIQSGGLMIACEDTEALDEFENLLNFFAGNTGASGPDMTIFYLKHTKAAVAAEILDQVFGGGTLSSGGAGGGGGLMGGLASAALGDAGGGLLGSLMGLGGGGGTISASGTLRITPDTRLNALIVQANPIDLQMIEELLVKIDEAGPPDEILAVPRAKLVTLVNTRADEIASILQEVYRDRVATANSSGGQGGRPSPQDLMQILRGGGSRGGRSGGGGATEQVQKMSMSVDVRTNSLIVAAPEPLLEEVTDLIAQLDRAALERSGEITRVIPLRRAGSDAVQQALSVLGGESIRTSSPSSRSTGGRPTPTATPAAPSPYRPPMMNFRPPTSTPQPASSARPSGGSPRPGGATPGRPTSRGPTSGRGR